MEIKQQNPRKYKEMSMKYDIQKRNSRKTISVYIQSKEHSDGNKITKSKEI